MEKSNNSPDIDSSPQVSRNKTWLIVLLGIVLVCAAAGGVYFWQQSVAKKQQAELQSQIDNLKKQVADAEKKVKETEVANVDETKDWKTYNNTYWSYSIKYPTDYAVFISGNCPGTNKTKEDNTSVSVAKVEDRLPICNADKFGQMTFYAKSGQPTADKDFTSEANEYYSDLRKTEVTLNGIKGYRYVYTSTGNGMQPKGSKGITIEFGKSGTVYKAHYHEYGSSYPSDLETFDKIVNKTWKF